MKENQRIAITKRMLQEGLLRLLKNKDIDKIKVTELCEESGINRATFYRHYELPRDVLDELRKNILEEIRILLLSGSNATNPEKSLEAMCRYCYEHAEPMTILFKSRNDEGFDLLLKEFYYLHLSEFQKVEQELHIDQDVLLLASYYYAGGIYFILRRWLTENIQKSPTEVARLIYRVIAGSSADLLLDSIT